MTAIVFLVVCVAVLAGTVLTLLWATGRTRLWPPILLTLTAPLEVYRTNVGPFNLSLFRLALALALVLLVIDIAKGRVRTLRPPVVLVVYGLLLAWQAVSLAAVTTQTSLGYRFLSQYAAGLGAAYVISRYVGRSDIAIMAIAYSAAAFLPLAASTLRVFSVESGGSGNLPGLNLLHVDPAIRAARDTGSFLVGGVQRMQGTFSDPNHFGFFIATATIVTLGLLAAALLSRSPERTPRALLAGALTLSCIVGLAGSYSRSAWLLAAVGLFVALLVNGRQLWTVRRVVAAIAGLAIVATVLAPAMWSRINPDDPSAKISNAEHQRTMSRALDLAKDHPLTGVGLGAYGAHVGQPHLVSSSHSTVLTVGAELGLPGALLLVSIMGLTAYAAVRSSLRRSAVDRAIGSGLAAAFTGLAAANLYYEVWMDDFQWVLFGLVIAALDPIELPERKRLSIAAARSTAGVRASR